jgi:hypothetical protein
MKTFLNHIFAGLRITYMAEGPNTAFRKKQFLEVGGYSDLPIMDDTEITTRLRKLGKIKYDIGLYVYASIRRMEKSGASNFGVLAITSWFKLTFLGKESIKLKGYAKQEY